MQCGLNDAVAVLRGEGQGATPPVKSLPLLFFAFFNLPSADVDLMQYVTIGLKFGQNDYSVQSN